MITKELFTTLDSSDLDLVHGGLDFSRPTRALKRGVETAADGAVLGGTGGLVIGGLTGAFGGPATAGAGALIGGAAGAVGGGIVGFATGVGAEYATRAAR